MTTVVDREGGLLLNCDISHRVLRSSTVLHLLSDVYNEYNVRKGTSGTKRDFHTSVRKQVVGETVLTRYNNKFYKVDDMDFESSPMSTFVDAHGRSVTYK